MLFCDCVQNYFRTYLMQQRGYGANTLGSYRDTFRLLMAFLSEAGLEIETLEMADVGRGLVVDFLCWLESSRGNAPSTRNVRLAHVKSFAAFIATVSPEDAGACAAIASIPAKRQSSGSPDALSKEEVNWNCYTFLYSYMREAIPATERAFHGRPQASAPFQR